MMSTLASNLVAKKRRVLAAGVAAVLLSALPALAQRSRESINEGWKFIKGDAPNSGGLQYDVRPAGARRGVAAEGEDAPQPVSKAWILPSSNDFLKDPAKAFSRPEANLGADLAFVQAAFDDSAWTSLNLPHDYAIAGPFISTGDGGMGRLPTSGVSWYRKSLNIPAADAGKSIFLDIDGAMSYSMVWLNGQLVGGWPYGYSSYRLDLTPYIKSGSANQLAIRLDNLPSSSRWYPGAGIYRNVWIVKTNPVHIGHWGVAVTTPDATVKSADIKIARTIVNTSDARAMITIGTEIFELDSNDVKSAKPVATIQEMPGRIDANSRIEYPCSIVIQNPKLWGVGPNQKPNRYVAVTTIKSNGAVIDVDETPFGVRTLKFDPNEGFFLNGERIRVQGVCNHHDLGALGAAINTRGLERQLEILKEMGCNAIRTSHNPPAPELLDLCDKMGFLVMDEAFDCWAAKKTDNDYHLLWADWHEQDLRAMIRRDRNHPSVFMWSIGNEVQEQNNPRVGEPIARELVQICKEEDPTRPTVSGMNSARPDSIFTRPIDTIGLNYQGAGLNPVKRPPGTPQYPLFHKAFPDKFVVGAETASTVSSRGFYTFPVADNKGISADPGAGVIAGIDHVSSYDVYHAYWAQTPDKEFEAQDRQPFVAGEFVWTGFDYLGEPTPFDTRSSYFGIIDLAGFKKDRFYLYQARWNPELPMAHLLPHWTWPDRVGQQTPVMVYTSGDEAELFVNGKSKGKKKKAQYEYRLRWDDVNYEPGEIKVIAYKNGKEWATDLIKTASDPAKLKLTPDRATINADGVDLSFVTLDVTDKDGVFAPRADNAIAFEITGPGEIVATDNGDPTDMTAFPSRDRKAFSGKALVIVRSMKGRVGQITVSAKSPGLTDASVTITSR